MSVEDAAVFDARFSPSELREAISHASAEARENLAQLAAVSAICNAAVIEVRANSGNDEKPSKEREVIGDATGALPRHLLCTLC